MPRLMTLMQKLAVALILICTSNTQAMSRKPKEEPIQKNITKLSGKSLGYFQTQVAREVYGDSQVKVVVRVQARRPMPATTFQWKIPDHWEVLSGETTGQAEFMSGELKTFTLVVNKTTMKENDQAQLFVFSMKKGEKHGASALFVYTKDESDAVKAQNKRSTKSKKPLKYHE